MGVKPKPFTAKDRDGNVRSESISWWSEYNGKPYCTIRTHKNAGRFTPEQIVGTEKVPERNYLETTNRPAYEEDFRQCKFNNKYILRSFV